MKEVTEANNKYASRQKNDEHGKTRPISLSWPYLRPSGVFLALKGFFPFAFILNYFLFHLSENIKFLLASMTTR
jgi:hypothetical protein